MIPVNQEKAPQKKEDFKPNLVLKRNNRTKWVLKELLVKILIVSNQRSDRLIAELILNALITNNFLLFVIFENEYNLRPYEIYFLIILLLVTTYL